MKSSYILCMYIQSVYKIRIQESYINILFYTLQNNRM